MKIRISESKIRQIVNEGVLKVSLNKTMAEQKWPNYSAYLLAEILKLEWESTLTESNSEQKPSPEWIAETAAAFGLSDEEVQEATDIMNNDELNIREGGFWNAIAQPYKNLWQTFTNITQNAANLTDPDAQRAAAVVDKVEDELPKPEELDAKAKSGDEEELMAFLRGMMDVLRKGDQQADLETIAPGLEAGTDKIVDKIGGVVDQAGEEEGGGQTAAVYKGKGGKGLQSFLARGSEKAKKLKGKAMGAVLKHMKDQLEAQGVTVTEGVLDEVQGWMWYGLVEDMMQEHYGQKILISDILEELNEANPGSKQKRRGSRGGRAKRKAPAQRPSGGMSSSSGKERKRSTAQRDNDMGRLSQSDNAKAGMMDRSRPAAEEPAAEEPAAAEERPGVMGPDKQADSDAATAWWKTLPEPQKSDLQADGEAGMINAWRDAGKPAAGGGGEEAPVAVKPTVPNDAPEGSPVVKVFRGKGGEGLQSALARSRDKLGIDQRTVSVIIKSVEQWAQANQIKVENVSADVFDTILAEISTKYQARRLKETIQKLRNV
jgi:hypothetical protein